MTTANYTIEGNRLFHDGRDTRITITRTSNHHWELSAGPEPAGAFIDFPRAFSAACKIDRAARARCAAFNALHDLATIG